jgi:UDP-N-acetylmuramoylalanine-D-glutamate ligase
MIPVRGFEGRKVAVLGLGRTGLTAARALVAGGAQVALWDENPTSREAAAAEGFAVEDLKAGDWTDIAALMLSPGIPLTHPRPHWSVEKAAAAGNATAMNNLANAYQNGRGVAKNAAKAKEWRDKADQIEKAAQ